jgi:hypothetical protein
MLKLSFNFAFIMQRVNENQRIYSGDKNIDANELKTNQSHLLLLMKAKNDFQLHLRFFAHNKNLYYSKKKL